MAQHEAGEHQDAHHVNYMYVFAALCIFTVLSILADGARKIGLSHTVLIVLVLAVASAKALSVMLYFMHLKFERNWKYLLLVPTVILAIGVPLALVPDIAFHYYVEDVPQLREQPKSPAVSAPEGESLVPSDSKTEPGHGGH